MAGHGDLNNSHAARKAAKSVPDPAYCSVSFAIPEGEDDPEIRRRYRPFLLTEEHAKDDWVAVLELSTALKMVESHILDRNLSRLRILVLYGSLRTRYVKSPPCICKAICILGI